MLSVKCFKHQLNGKIIQQNGLWTSVLSQSFTTRKIMHVWPRNKRNCQKTAVLETMLIIFLRNDSKVDNLLPFTMVDCQGKSSLATRASRVRNCNYRWRSCSNTTSYHKNNSQYDAGGGWVTLSLAFYDCSTCLLASKFYFFALLLLNHAF